MQAIMQKLMALIMSILSFLGITIPNSNTTDKITVEGTGYRYTIDNEEKTINLALRSNPTTGYNWSQSISGDAVKLTEDNYVADKVDPDVCGGGGTHYYEFTAVKEGSCVLTFVYSRQWKNGEVNKTYYMTLVVDAELNITVQNFNAN